MEKEIEVGNKMIALFMAKITGKHTPIYEGFERKSYHSEWSWLISALETIEGLGYSTQISCYDNYHTCSIKQGNYRWGYGENDSKLLSTYQAVTSFIQWYNEQNK